MTTLVQKWGNSLAIRIPNAFAKQVKFQNGTPVKIIVDEDSIIVSTTQEEYSLDAMLAQIDENDVYQEVDFGKSVGSEEF